MYFLELAATNAREQISFFCYQNKKLEAKHAGLDLIHHTAQ